MGFSKVKLGTALSIFGIVLGIYFRNSEQLLQQRLHSVLTALENLENSYKVNPRPRVAVGYGICTDVYIEAGNLLEWSEEMGQPQHFDEISSKEELMKSFAYYFRHGAAAELV